MDYYCYIMYKNSLRSIIMYNLFISTSCFFFLRYYYFIPVIVTLGITLAISNKKTRIESRNGLANGVNGLDKSLDKKTQ